MVLVVVSALAYSALVGSASQPSASRSPAEPTDANRLSRSQAVLDQAVQSSEPGCSAAVGRRGEILWTGVAGVSNVQRRDPITADTVFDAGSVSKQFTATAVLLLQQEGKLSVDDRLSRHVDGLPAWSDQVTLAQLMHHVSGIPETEDILLNKGFQPQDRVKSTRPSSPKIVSSERRCERRSPMSNASTSSPASDGRTTTRTTSCSPKWSNAGPASRSAAT
jgi:CubicO group peptidase (beta-lactamase class C family)